MTEKKSSPEGSSFWQIIFPTLVSTGLMILIGIWAARSLGDGEVTRFAEISTVLLVLPVMVTSLILFLILGGGIALISRMIGAIPPVTSKVLEFLVKVQQGMGKVSEFIIQPVVRPSALLSGLRSIFTRSRSKLRIE